jgi:hypothetical protein
MDVPIPTTTPLLVSNPSSLRLGLDVPDLGSLVVFPKVVSPKCHTILVIASGTRTRSSWRTDISFAALSLSICSPLEGDLGYVVKA